MEVAVAPNRMKLIYAKIKIAYKINAIIGITETLHQRVFLRKEKFEVDLTTATAETVHVLHTTEITALGQEITDPDHQCKGVDLPGGGKLNFNIFKFAAELAKIYSGFLQGLLKAYKVLQMFFLK